MLPAVYQGTLWRARNPIADVAVHYGFTDVNGMMVANLRSSQVDFVKEETRLASRVPTQSNTPRFNYNLINR